MKSSLTKYLLLILLLIPYLSYVVFVIAHDQGPVDYETFMRIGQNLLKGSEVYGENSFYPLPYVMVFSIFSILPRQVSMALWLLLPVILALMITGWHPFVLLFAPIFAHFVGGQTAVFGLLGLWGYRKHLESGHAIGGFWLGLTLLKPQLGLMPISFALWQWLKIWHTQKRIPNQALAWFITAVVIYLPSFLVMPDWPLRWLNNPRPLYERAMAGFIPRTLVLMFNSNSGGNIFWLIWFIISFLLLMVTFFYAKRRSNLDLLLLWSFIVNPLVHDYDLIQLIALLDTRLLRWGAVIFSIPGWWVIINHYSNDYLWYVFTFIAPGLMALWLYQEKIAVRDAGIRTGLPNLAKRIRQ